MGSQPSRLAATHTPAEKAVIERLRRLKLEELEASDDEDYTLVNEKTALDGPARQPAGLPVEALTNWQSTVLQDPKNK